MSNHIRSAFIYLMHLAWKSRLHIPFLLTVCFLVFDIRLQLEVNVNMTRRRVQRVGVEAGDDDDNNNNDNRPNRDVIDDNAEYYYDGEESSDEPDEDERDDDSRRIENSTHLNHQSTIVTSENVDFVPEVLFVPSQKSDYRFEVILQDPELIHKLLSMVRRNYFHKKKNDLSSRVEIAVETDNQLLNCIL